MKKTFLFFTIIIFALTVNAQTGELLFSDSLNHYTVGNLGGQGSWVKFGSGPDALVSDAITLEYPGYNYNGGKVISFPANSSSSSRVYYDLANTSYSMTSPGTVAYLSLLLNITSTYTDSSGYFFSLGSAPSTSNYYAKLFAHKLTDNTYRLGVSKTSNTANFSTKELNLNQTYLVVVRYNVNNTALNQFGNTCYMWINPTGASEPDTATADAKVWAGQPDYNAPHISAVMWHNRKTANPLGYIDGIRLAASINSSATAWDALNPGPLPVELTSFSANAVKGNVQINWTTASETNNKGFDIERKAEGKSWTKIGSVDGSGTTTQSKNYSYTDKNLSNGKYSYRLKQIDYDGTYTYSKTAEVNVSSPVAYELSQNYPNPFNPSTSIEFTIPEAGFVTLKVYNMLGQEVSSLVNGIKAAGSHTIQLNADNLNSGLYLYKIEAGSFTQVRKMTLLK